MKILLSSLVVLLSACAGLPMGSPQRSEAGGHAVTHVSAFATAPTVVFEAGLGDGLGSWSEVYRPTQAFAGTFAYSRPGYSAGLFRGPLGGQRTAADAARLLHELLATLGAPAPYVLVGHSIGGLYVLEFARRYPQQVAALVLVDARLPAFTPRCEAADAGLCRPPAAMTLLAPVHVAAEIRGIGESEENAPSAADIGAIPTTLIAATRPPPGASARAQPIWLAVQREFAQQLQDGRLVIAEGSGHYIQREAPALVLEAIREAVAGYAARAGEPAE